MEILSEDLIAMYPCNTIQCVYLLGEFYGKTTIWERTSSTVRKVAFHYATVLKP